MKNEKIRFRKKHNEKFDTIHNQNNRQKIIISICDLIFNRLIRYIQIFDINRYCVNDSIKKFKFECLIKFSKRSSIYMYV